MNRRIDFVIQNERKAQPLPQIPPAVADAPRNIDPVSLLLAGPPRPAAPGKIDSAPTRLSGLRGLFYPAGDRRAKPRGDTALNLPDRAMTALPVERRLMQQHVGNVQDVAAARGAARGWTAKLQSPPRRPVAAGRAEESLAKKGSYNQNILDGIRILPARRGQYWL
jgi:hypothetical protein